MFHRIVRLKKDDLLYSNKLEGFREDGYTVIPLISPRSDVGNLLMDEENSAWLSTYSEDSGTNIIYLNKNTSSYFEEFCSRVLTVLKKVSSIKPKDPSVLVFIPNFEKIFIFECQQEEVDQFKQLMFSILDAIESENMEKELSNLRLKNKIIKVGKEHTTIIRELFVFIKEIIFQLPT